MKEEKVSLKTIIKCINLFLENLYVEFIDWAKFLLLSLGGIFLAIFLWQGEGWTGKMIDIVTAVFLVTKAVAKTFLKFADEKIERRRNKTITE
jgi:ABC-type uncharacterized transport system permease subunit